MSDTEESTEALAERIGFIRCQDMHGVDRDPALTPCRSCHSWGERALERLAPQFAAYVRGSRADAWREGAAAGHHSPLTWYALRRVNPYLKETA